MVSLTEQYKQLGEQIEKTRTEGGLFVGKGFQRFVEWFGECKYVPVGSRCSICGKKLNFFHTGFWSVNVQNYNGHLSDGVLCVACREKAEHLIKTKKKWLGEELQALDQWQKFDARNMDFYSLSDIKMLIEQKELSGKSSISSCDNRGTGLYEIEESFGLDINEFTVGVFRNKKLSGKTVAFGTSEQSTFQKDDRVKVYIEDLEFEATVLEAHRFDKEAANGRNMEKIFFDELSANLKIDSKIKKNQQGWLILDIDWKYKLDGGIVVKIR